MTCTAFVPVLLEQDARHILNTASVAGLLGRHSDPDRRSAGRRRSECLDCTRHHLHRQYAQGDVRDNERLAFGIWPIGASPRGEGPPLKGHSSSAFALPDLKIALKQRVFDVDSTGADKVRGFPRDTRLALYHGVWLTDRVP